MDASIRKMLDTQRENDRRISEAKAEVSKTSANVTSTLKSLTDITKTFKKKI